MSVALFAPYNWVHEDGVSIAGGNWGPSPDTLLSALLNTDTLHKVRSIGTTLAATKYTVDLGQTRRMDTAWVGYHNGTKNAKVRLTFTGAPPAFDHDFKSGTLPAGWTFQRAAIATFEDAAGVISYAPIDSPRFDWRGGVARGLLMEEERTNLQARSIDMTVSPWGIDPSWISVVGNNAVAPDGQTTADKIVESNVNTVHGLDGGTFTTVPGATYTISKWFKYSGRQWVILRPYDGTTTHWGYFDIQNGALGNVRSGDRQRIRAGTSGWYRVSLTFVATGTTASVTWFFATTNGTNPNPSYAGDGVSGAWVWNAQPERGAFPSSDIITGAAPVTRPIDVLFADTLVLPWWQDLPMTAHVKVRRPHNALSIKAGGGNFSPALSAWNAASHPVVNLGLSPEYGGAGTSMKAFGSYFAGVDLGGDNVNEDVSVSMAIAFQSGGSGMSVDGQAATISAASYGADTATRVYVAGQGAGDGALDGWVERVSFWTARLADAKLLAGTLDHADFSGVEHQTSWLDIVPTTQAPVGGFLPFGRVAADGKLPDDERDPRGASMLIELGLDVDAQAVVVEFDDTLNPAGHFEHSILVLAKAAHWQTSIENGFTPGAINDTRAERDGAGGFWGRQMWRRRTIEMVLPWQHVDRALAETLEQQLRLGNVLPCLFAAQIHGGIHDPRLVYYGRLLGPSRVQQVRHVRYGAAFNIEEL